ncbi:2-dehydropantoate 2-reductase [Propioniciclava tarda]|uniref:2-dehydropantoate 2-reductase n=1 Tax=Propioniciclava tarda TaxID=433330 RepID=A0A4Q9KNX7_PROTD|nr:2-dehydropantoate 2-reductase [Propioniciclava tarda]TBT96278.1 2-dehydropantoate 2-reductase [Propioniciclava tarda]SMO34724.1 ketopantoate reductase [Propioniciclava tarda]
MRIAIIGAGGIGGYFGGFLARSGADVTFVVRGATLAALRERGLTVQGEHGFTTPVRVTDDIASLGVVDVLIPTTKTQSFADALGAALPTVGPETLVLTVQNGVETPDVAASIVGAGHVEAGIVRVFTWIAEAGVIGHGGAPGTITLPSGGRHGIRLDALADAFAAAGVPVLRSADIAVDLWSKAMFVAPFGGIGGLTGLPFGGVRTELRDTLVAVIREIEAVARGRGVRLPTDAVERTLATVDAMPYEVTSSLQRDLRAGVPNELDAQIGAICRYGDAGGVPTPLHDLMYRALLPA